ncbi:hypothetical protein Cus16_1076 [Curtobacterium sp. ER1/6]|nr:hypothetical protein Cus16_1076 [Curtobacterium sp. ER1/6]
MADRPDPDGHASERANRVRVELGQLLNRPLADTALRPRARAGASCTPSGCPVAIPPARRAQRPPRPLPARTNPPAWLRAGGTRPGTTPSQSLPPARRPRRPRRSPDPRRPPTSPNGPNLLARSRPRDASARSRAGREDGHRNGSTRLHERAERAPSPTPWCAFRPLAPGRPAAPIRTQDPQRPGAATRRNGATTQRRNDATTQPSPLAAQPAHPGDRRAVGAPDPGRPGRDSAPRHHVEAPERQGRVDRADRLGRRGVDRRHQQARRSTGCRDRDARRIDDDGPTDPHRTGLADADHPDGVLDRPSGEQRAPVVLLPRTADPLGRQDDDVRRAGLRSREPSGHLGEAQVVAGLQPDPHPAELKDGDLVDRAGLDPVGLPRPEGVVQVHLPVGRGDRPVGVHRDEGVAEPTRHVGRLGDADHERDADRPRHLTQPGHERPVERFRCGDEPVVDLRGEPRRVLGRDQQVGPAGGSVLGGGPDGSEVREGVVDGGELRGGDREGAHPASVPGRRTRRRPRSEWTGAFW